MNKGGQLSKKWKILFTIPNFDTAGSGKALLNIASRLDKKIFEPHIACLHDKGDFFKVVKESGFPVHIFQFTTPMISRIKGLVQCWRISRQIKKINPHIIHSFHYAPDYSEALSARLAGIPWIFTKKNMNWGGKSKNGWKLRSIFSDHIIIQNTDMKKQFYPSSLKTTLISRGVDTIKFKPKSKNQKLLNKYSIAENEKVIITVANLVPVKGIEVLIDAFELLCKKYVNIHLFIVGDKENKYGYDLNAKVKKLNSKNRIYFIGKVRDVFDYYSIADIFVLPTLNVGRKEGCPVSLLEAMACGITILASNISGINDILDPFQDCLFDSGDVIDLINKLDQLLQGIENSEENIELIKYVTKYYCINQEVKLHDEVYQKLLV